MEDGMDVCAGEGAGELYQLESPQLVPEFLLPQNFLLPRADQVEMGIRRAMVNVFRVQPVLEAPAG